MTDYNGKKQRVLRNNGEVYILSPYTLYWNEDNYYVIGYSDKHDNISVFRVDRMSNVRMLNEKSETKPKAFKAKDYADKIFSMYAGENEVVELECENSMMKYLIDRFGVGVETEPMSNTDYTSPVGRFRAKVEVTLTPTFYSWVFQFEGKIKIIGPERALKEYRAMLNC